MYQALGFSLEMQRCNKDFHILCRGRVIFGVTREECVGKGSHLRVLPNTGFKDSPK